MIFLDNATATKPSETALRAMWPFFETHFQAPSSPYELSDDLFPMLEAAKKRIGALLHAKESDYAVLTASGGEAVSQVAMTVYREVSQRTGKTHFVTSEIEDAPITEALLHLEEESCHVSFAKVNKYGQVTEESLIEALTPRTALFSISLVSGLTGVLQPISELSAICKERGVLLHIDVTHAIGKLQLNFEELNAAFITFNGEQLQAPRGTGMLFARGIKPVMLIHGATLQSAALVALGQAALEAENNLTLYGTEVARLRSLFEETLVLTCPFAKVLCDNAERAPHITVIAFEGIVNELLLFHLAKKKIFANIGGGLFRPLTAALQAMGAEPLLSMGAISFAFSKEITERDVIKAATIISETATRLKRLSKALV